MKAAIRASCATQLWLLRHPNFLTRAALTAFYSVEVIVYTLQGARTFLTKRQALYGPNFAALGRMIVGEYEEVKNIIDAPQRRGAFLGRGRMMASRLPPDFLLFLSDEEAGGDGTHRVLHDYIWEEVVRPALDRLEDEALQLFVDDLVREVRAEVGGGTPTEKQVTSAVQQMVIRYMMHVLFEVHLTQSHVEAMQTLFYTGGPTTNYVASRLKPVGPPGFMLGKMHDVERDVLAHIVGSSALEGYEASERNRFLTKKEFGELLMAVVGIAACGGGGNLAAYILTEVPDDYEVDLNDQAEVYRVVLETARRHAPVNNVNVITGEPRTFRVKGEAVELPAGTVVAGSIGLAGLDPAAFPDPMGFDPHRANLLSGLLNFNAVGYHDQHPTGPRGCPGRHIAVQMCAQLFVAWRKSAA